MRSMVEWDASMWAVLLQRPLLRSGGPANTGSSHSTSLRLVPLSQEGEES